MSANTEHVLAFIRSFEGMRIDETLGFLHPECVYHNIPVPPVTGHAAIRAVLESFLGMASECEWIVHAVAESDEGKVLTERTDRFRMSGQWIELPVMGAFELEGGTITAWRDYFDMEQFRSQLPSA